MAIHANTSLGSRGTGGRGSGSSLDLNRAIAVVTLYAEGTIDSTDNRLADALSVVEADTDPTRSLAPEALFEGAGVDFPEDSATATYSLLASLIAEDLGL